MQRVKQTFKSGPAGIANVVVDENKELVRVSFISGDNEGETFKIDLDNAPESVRSGKFYVALSGKGDTIFSVRPAVGSFVVKFVKWGRKEGTPAIPKEKVGKYGPYQTMTAILKIMQGQCKGMDIPLQLIYKFLDDGNGNVAISTSDKHGTASEKLDNFLVATGVMDDPMTYTENILPMLEKKILKKNQLFSVVLKEGYVDYISSLEGVGMDTESDDENEDDEEEEELTNKHSKKTAQVTDEAEDENELPFEPDPPKAESAKKAAKKIRPDVDEE